MGWASNEVLSSEINCIHFLQLTGVILHQVYCPGKRAERCGSVMHMIQRIQKSGRTSIQWRCSRKECRAERSVRSNSRLLKF